MTDYATIIRDLLTYVYSLLRALIYCEFLTVNSSSVRDVNEYESTDLEKEPRRPPCSYMAINV